MRLLIDMNLSPRWVEALSQAGFAACHWSTVGVGNAPDAEIMAYARTHNYVVLTHDLDFGAILAATHGHKPSVVQIRSAELSPNIIGSQVVAALKQMADEIEAGALLTIEPGKTRLRVLPLQNR